MIYFTSDFHFGHRNIIKFNDRPFNNIDEMNNKLIDNYNSIINNKDTVYILGDISFRISIEESNEYIKQLKGNKIIVYGNHDKNYNDNLFIKKTYFDVLKYNKQKFCLMHYPMLSWPGSHQGSIQLHGHIHGKYEENVKNRLNGIYRYDVGVDANNYYPVSIEQIISFFKDGDNADE